MIRRTTWMLLIIFVLLLVGTLLWQRSRQQGEAKVTPTAAVSFLLDLMEQPVQGLRLSDNAGKVIDMQKGLDGSWVLVEPAGELADPARIEDAVSQVNEIRILSPLEKSMNLKDVGLNPAAYTIQVNLAEGTEIRAYIGDQTPTQGGYYAFKEGGSLTVVDAFTVDNLLKILADPPFQRTPTPSPGPELTATAQP